MDEIFSVDVEAFPSKPNIYMSFNSKSADSNLENPFEIEVERSEQALSKLLKQLKPTADGGNPLNQYTQMSKEILSTNVGSFNASKKVVGNLIDIYCGTPDKEAVAFPGTTNFPSRRPHEPIFIKVTERVKLNKESILNGELIEEGTVITFHHKGRIE